MADTTTIKVPKELRDRIASAARRQHVPLAAVIAQALDVSEERAFWSAVRQENASLTIGERQRLVPDATIADDVDDDSDASISMRDGW